MAHKRRLKARISLYLLACLVLALATAYVSGRLFAGWYTKNIEGQQLMLVSRIAEELDDKIGTAQKIIIMEARQFTPVIVADPRLADHELRNHIIVESIFDSGLFLFPRRERSLRKPPSSHPVSGLTFRTGNISRQPCPPGNPIFPIPLFPS